jgi:ligand-binding sensor domain-containing protein
MILSRRFRSRQEEEDAWCHRRRAVLLLVVLFWSSLSAQQFEARFKSLTLEQGLSQNTVRCMIQDSRGFMWFGGADGLNRYDGYKFVVYKVEPGKFGGLQHSMIRSLFQDHTGSLWVGTEGGGLYRFDAGARIVGFQYDPRDTTTLSNNYVFALCESRDGTLWVGTDGGGLNKYDREKEQFVRFACNSGDQGSPGDDRVSSISEDSSGALWVGTRGGGLCRLDPQTGTSVRYTADAKDADALSSDDVLAVHVDHTGVVWVGTTAALERFDPRRNAFVHYRHDPNNPRSLSSGAVWTVYRDRSGVVWAGTNGGGLNRMVADSAPRRGSESPASFVRYVADPSNTASLSNNIVLCILEDRSGVLWFGTESGGVCRLEKYSTKFAHYTVEPGNSNSLNDRSVWSFFEDRSGVLWIGTRTGGLNRFDRGKNQFSFTRQGLNDAVGLGLNFVRSIYEDRSGVMWLGTDGGGLARMRGGGPGRAPEFIRYTHEPADPTSLSCPRVYSILQDRTGTLWIGTRTGGLNRFVADKGRFLHYHPDQGDSTSISDDFIYKIYEDRSGDVWIGTFTHGLNKLIRSDDPNASPRFVRYGHDPDDPGSLSNDCVLTILQDSRGVVWIGTGGGGINRLVREPGGRGPARFIHYTEKDGLGNNFVYGILEDGRGYLWMSTNRGISRFDPKTGLFKNYDMTDGVQSNEFNGGAYLKNRAGEMFFGGINGFNVFQPDSVRDNPYVPPVVLTDFRLFERSIGKTGDLPLPAPIQETSEITLSHRENIFAFEFAALSYTSPEKNQYRYRLEGLDPDWIPTDASHRVVSYMNLPPGDYVFRARGSNNDGVWNEAGVAVRVTVKPPFWATWWFRALAAFLGAGIVLIGYRRRLRAVRMTAELEAAHRAQLSIMPLSDPQVPGFDISGACRPANEVGGDFFDFLWFDSARIRFGIVLGDVSGKAMPSAMTAVLTNGMVCSRAEMGLSVSELLTEVNRSVHRKTDKKTFVALCLASLDSSQKRLTFANAGLIRPLLRRGEQVRSLDAPGVRYPLGMGGDYVYDEASLPLQSGDLLVFVTDGITEERSPDKELYGEERLHKLLAGLEVTALRAGEIKEAIIRSVLQFSGGSTQDDDITVVVVKVK